MTRLFFAALLAAAAVPALAQELPVMEVSVGPLDVLVASMDGVPVLECKDDEDVVIGDDLLTVECLATFDEAEGYRFKTDGEAIEISGNGLHQFCPVHEVVVVALDGWFCQPYESRLETSPQG